MSDVEEVTVSRGEKLTDKEIIHLEEIEESTKTEAQLSKNYNSIRNCSQRSERT
jgi:hypothetical protein